MTAVIASGLGLIESTLRQIECLSSYLLLWQMVLKILDVEDPKHFDNSMGPNPIVTIFIA